MFHLAADGRWNVISRSELPVSIIVECLLFHLHVVLYFICCFPVKDCSPAAESLINYLVGERLFLKKYSRSHGHLISSGMHEGRSFLYEL